MTWDHYLLRRFSSTNHFKLINQVRNELAAQPLKRDIQTRKLIIEAKPTHGSNFKSNNKYISNKIIRNEDVTDAIQENDERSDQSFIERVNSIQMR